MSMSTDSSSITDSPADNTGVTSERSGVWIGPFSIVYVLLAFFGSQIIASIGLLRYGMDHGLSGKQIDAWLNSSVPAQFFFVAVSEVLLIVAIYFGLRLLHWTWRTIGLSRPTITQLLTGIVATVPYYVLYIIIVAVVSRFVPGLNVDQKQDVGFNDVTGHLALILTFLSLVVLPPLAEEITMRGFLYTGLRKWLPRIAAGLVVSLLFGAAHLAEGGDAGPLWIGAIDTFTLSMVLVYLRERTGNLWAGIVLHACKNGLAFLLLYVLHAG
jgi:membrane protease YdiL (CAAX protease family)